MNTNAALIVPAQAPASNNAAAAPMFQAVPKPLIDIPNTWLWVFAIGALLILAVAFYFWWQWWQKKRAVLRMPAPMPAHVRARRKLEQALAMISEPPQFSVLVSGAIREYLEERFELHAPDRTTEEFLYELQSSHLLTHDQKGSLGDFLASCDLIKFAKYEPTELELRGLHAAALRLVNETEPRLVPDSIQSSVASPPSAMPPPPPPRPVPVARTDDNPEPVVSNEENAQQ